MNKNSFSGDNMNNNTNSSRSGSSDNTADDPEGPFKLEPEKFQQIMAEWARSNLPVQLLVQDHFSAKILTDNNVFKKIKFFNHTWKWDNEEGLLLLYKPSPVSKAEWTPWKQILSTVELREVEKPVLSRSDSWENFLLLHNKASASPKSPPLSEKSPEELRQRRKPESTGLQTVVSSENSARHQLKETKFVFGEGVDYTEEGFVIERTFRFSNTAFSSMLQKWIQEGWPVEFLMRDHFGAKVFFDNQVFQLIDFYGHGYQWSEEKGIIIHVKEHPDKPWEWVPWAEVVPRIAFHRTVQDWHLFDGWNYTYCGLVPTHLWQWERLDPSYVFPPERKPDLCYLDIYSYSWEHEGLQGFGVAGGPHGHLAIEFGDDLGNFYSVGLYMDPKTLIDTKVQVAATVRSVLMSPDPYLSSKGEKTLHRYSLGSGPEGREKFAKLIKHLESIQNFKKDPKTGIVRTCSGRKYSTFGSNCGHFVYEIEDYVRTQLDGKLVPITEDTILVPNRENVPRQKKTWYAETAGRFGHGFVLFVINFLIFFLMSTPWVSSKVGVGAGDDFSDEYDQAVQGTSNRRSSNKLVFPRSVRIEQLYSPRLKDFSGKLR